MSNLLTKLLVFPLVVGSTSFFWFGDVEPVASASAPAPQPQVTSSVIVAPARVEPVRDVALAFETGGRIVSIEVEEGQTVTAGQVIARLDDRVAKARVAAADAGVAAAQANYLLARRGPRREDLAAAKAELDAAKAAAAHRSAESERSDKLGAAGALADSIVAGDDAVARVAEANAAGANARYQALAHGSRAEQITVAAAQLDGALAELEAAKASLDQTVLRAPWDGLVVRRFAEIGALVTAISPQTIVKLADLGKLELRAELDEADIDTIAVGKTAYATATAFGDRTFPVRITRITRELGRKTVEDDDPRARVDTRVLEVLAELDSKPGQPLPLGLRMSVHIER
jgi:multidrug resistance efflux pump